LSAEHIRNPIVELATLVEMKINRSRPGDWMRLIEKIQVSLLEPAGLFALLSDQFELRLPALLANLIG
jgi:hypothetical protein